MPNPEKITLANLIFDEDNPNEMSAEQEASLGISMKEFGYIGDMIIVAPKDKKGKQLIHHGEHRVRQLLSSGNEWVWGYVKKLSLLQHKALRQAMNKTHGEHDPVKDAKEIQFFIEKGKLEFLSSLIAQPTEQLMIAQESSVAVTVDTEMTGHHEDTFLHGKLKQLHFIFSNEEFEKIMPKIEAMMKDFKTDNHTDMFVKLVAEYFKNKQK